MSSPPRRSLQTRGRNRPARNALHPPRGARLAVACRSLSSAPAPSRARQSGLPRGPCAGRGGSGTLPGWPEPVSGAAPSPRPPRRRHVGHYRRGRPHPTSGTASPVVADVPAVAPWRIGGPVVLQPPHRGAAQPFASAGGAGATNLGNLPTAGGAGPDRRRRRGRRTRRRQAATVGLRAAPVTTRSERCLSAPPASGGGGPATPLSAPPKALERRPPPEAPHRSFPGTASPSGEAFTPRRGRRERRRSPGGLRFAGARSDGSPQPSSSGGVSARPPAPPAWRPGPPSLSPPPAAAAIIRRPAPFDRQLPLTPPIAGGNEAPPLPVGAPFSHDAGPAAADGIGRRTPPHFAPASLFTDGCLVSTAAGPLPRMLLSLA